MSVDQATGEATGTVEDAPFPTPAALAAARQGDDPAQPWRDFSLQEQGQLKVSNDRFGDAWWIISECERLMGAAFRRATRPAWKFWG